jgi:hypothetical protein
MRVIIAGGREFNDYDLLKQECINNIMQLKREGYKTKREYLEIVSGTARGADRLGEKFAYELIIPLKRFAADWNTYGKRAGYIRNEQMAKYASEDEEVGVLIAFWDGKSKGTKHMIDLAKRYKLRVFVVKY